MDARTYFLMLHVDGRCPCPCRMFCLEECIRIALVHGVSIQVVATGHSHWEVRFCWHRF